MANITKGTVLITAKVHPHLITALQQKDYDVHYLPTITYEELLQIIDQAEGLIVTTRLKIDKIILDKAKNLKWIGRLGSGMELIDVAYAKEKNIFCVSTPEGNSNAVAEHALGIILGLFRKIATSFWEIKEGKWLRDENRGTELSGKTFGIIGYGNTGKALAKLLHGFDVKILVYDKYKSNFGTNKIIESSLQAIQQEADIISFHLPLTEETTFFCNKIFLQGLQRKPYIINTSRGKIVNTKDLIIGLEHQTISGAGLDVLENENLNKLSEQQKDEFNFLTNHKQVIITPHIAGYSHESFHKMSILLLEKLGI